MDTRNQLNMLENKYDLTAKFYDILDFPWEYFLYRKWRPQILAEVSGRVLELGVGTGRNLAYYNNNIELTAVDLSQSMLNIATKRSLNLDINVNFLKADITNLNHLSNNYYDWVISTFLFCVLPNNLQAKAVEQFVDLLKPGGKFKIVEIIYSQNPMLKRRQVRIEKYVEKIFGARFDRNTLSELISNSDVIVNKTSFLRDDTYLLIEGQKK